jgi:hypothetical protein
MRIITFNQWKKRTMNRFFSMGLGICPVDLFAVWWWKGGTIGVTVFGLGFGAIL